jgi:MoaA/NifB/PqqE/SkfB family radical SAM enzyme
MARVRRSGVPLGISVTVNRNNLKEVLSDDFLNFFFNEQSAFYGFFFQYLPIGRCPSFENMPTPTERVAFWRSLWKIVQEKQIFLIDFWNHGPLAKGCISAGRGGGYLYIDWNGKVMPCVFVPYSVGNIHDIYRDGGTLNDVWEKPFFEAIRNWQDTYGYAWQEPTKDADWLRACPFRDHHSLFKKWVDLYKPDSEDEAASDVLRDGEYSQKLCEYELELSELFDKIWDEEYLSNR